MSADPCVACAITPKTGSTGMAVLIGIAYERSRLVHLCPSCIRALDRLIGGLRVAAERVSATGARL